MCGIAGIIGKNLNLERIQGMLESQQHRGPDNHHAVVKPEAGWALGHNRLSIIDLSPSSHQPMTDTSGRYWLSFNGEIYNYLELKSKLAPHYQFQTGGDTEVLLAAYITWGPACLDQCIGMFAFAIWDSQERTLFLARDRFGVKPLYYHLDSRGNLVFASEIKALHAYGVPREPNHTIWSSYLSSGVYDHSPQTFWQNIQALPSGHYLTWHQQQTQLTQWFSLAESVGDQQDQRTDEAVSEEYRHLLSDTIQLRFRADVAVGINLSGGLDSSLLLGLIHQAGIDQSNVKAFSFTCGDPAYDEWPWVQQMLTHTQHPFEKVLLQANDVPALSQSVHAHQDEPFGGIPTLAYAHLFEQAKHAGVTVLLDGQGMDEQWAGYDYYQRLSTTKPAPVIQGSLHSPVRPNCLRPSFLAKAETFHPPKPFQNALLDTQYRDVCHTKIPRALRFNDRISMRASRELREPFLDHRLVILAMRQPKSRKIQQQQGKWFLRKMAKSIIPNTLSEAPKRALQTPQREWLRGPLKAWVLGKMDRAAQIAPDWLDRRAMQQEWELFEQGKCDNSFFVWQWISIAQILAPSESVHV